MREGWCCLESEGGIWETLDVMMDKRKQLSTVGKVEVDFHDITVTR